MPYFTEFHEPRGRNNVILTKKGSMLSLGLPLGSGMVLIALLNTIFTAHSILNFVEILSIGGGLTVKNHLIPSLMVGFLFILTGYLWIGVIFTGRSYHVSIWIAGSLLLLLLKLVISSWTLLLSLRDALYWRKLTVLGVDIGMEIYILSLAVVAANVLWRQDDEGYLGSESDLGQSAPANFQDLFRALPLPPVGLTGRGFAKYYVTPGHVELGARVLVLLDVIYSVYILATEKIPEVLLSYEVPAEDGSGNGEDVASFSHSQFGERRLLLIFLEDMVIRIGRVIVGMITVSYLMKQRTPSRKLGHSLLAQLALVSLSMLIYFILFALFESLSPYDRFYQVKFTFDILLRLGLVGFLTRAVERRRAVQGGEEGFS